MPDLPTADALQELIARGLIAAQPAPRPLALGNADRQDRAARSSWCVALPAGGSAKLTLGHDLAPLADRHAAFAQACPAIATARLFFTPLRAGAALAETFFDGPNLEAALQDPHFPAAALGQALARISQALSATAQTSNEAARLDEWQSWSRRLLALPVWQPAERTVLEHTLLPALYARLASDSPVTRWTNGDFLPANILLNVAGESRLIDTEFAARTHFFAEDAVRFRVLSSATQGRPELDAALPPSLGLPWHLFFWLRQFQLEIEHNTPDYLARFTMARLGLIRRLGEHVLGAELPGWSAAALTAEHRIESITWSPDPAAPAAVTGWCYPPPAFGLRGIAALGPDGRNLGTVPPVPRPDVQQHFAGEPRALLSGFSLQLRPRARDLPVTLCAVVDHGTLVPFRVLTAGEVPCGLCWDDYPAWAARHDPDPAAPVATVANSGPLFSILLPVYRTPENYLHECINSVLAQHYPRWELCVVDDGSGSSDLTDVLNRFAAADPRIRVHPRPENGGISRATNDALALAKGEFVVLLDHDDLLRPHALAGMAAELARRPGLDAVYSDEDKITADGRRILPFLKPDFSPEFLRGVMYVGHVLCVRTAVARAVGGFDPAYDGVQDYEFLLRVTERTRAIGHLPRMLYHWRQAATSSALHGNVKGNMDEKQLAAVRAHLQRTGDSRRAVALDGHRVRLEAATLPAYELVHAERQASPLTLLRQQAKTSRAEVLVLLTDKVGPMDVTWLHELVALAALPDAGCTAPVLLLEDGRVYESGRIGQQPVLGGFHADSDGYNGSLRCNREVDAVSPACVALRRAVVVGLPEVLSEDWPEFCTRLRARGLYHRVCASARMRLTVPLSEGLVRTTRNPVAGEFYNPQFDPLSGDYSLAATSSRELRPAPRLQLAIDQPREWDSLPRCLVIRGWCFAGRDEPIRSIRLRTPHLTISGVIGLPRPDVKAAVPEAPDDNTGFEIRGTLSSGQTSIHLEARLADGSWRELIARPVKVQRQIRPFWLGGGTVTDLIAFQMPVHMAYPARPILAEKFPSPARILRPKLSLVTPSYNQASFLPETMRSVLDQAGIDCEYVVQDGGSTDGSAELIKQQSGRLHAWASERDHGQADAIAKGFARTSGKPEDIMAWINSDDFYLPGTLGYVADYFARHPAVDVLYGHRVVVDEQSQEIGRWFLPRHDDAVLRLNDFVPQETLFWRRRIWDKVGGIDPAFKFAMDWDLLLRFQAAGAKIVRVPYFLACFRVHSAQKTSARMHDIGQREINQLRERSQGRVVPPEELERNPRLLRYLRRSAFIEFLWKLGVRTP